MERPILFSAPMVNAILSRRKTQTRRAISPQPIDCGNGWYEWRTGAGNTTWHAKTAHQNIQTAPIDSRCPYGQPGDLLWVRESWSLLDGDYNPLPRTAKEGIVTYRADHITGNDGPGRVIWRPSIFMPRWASRITLRVTSVRVERLQEIRDMDAVAEGVQQIGSLDITGITTGETVKSFELLWDSINADRGYAWNDNPWVWVINFGKVAP